MTASRRAPRERTPQMLEAQPTASGQYEVALAIRQPPFQLTVTAQRRNVQIARAVAREQAKAALVRDDEAAFDDWCVLSSIVQRDMVTAAL